LAALLTIIGFPVPVDRLRHDLADGADAPEAEDLVRAARSVGCRATLKRLRPAELDGTLLPALAEIRIAPDEALVAVLLARVGADKVLVADPETGKPVEWTRDRFENAWTGRNVEVLPPDAAAAEERRFGWRWFLTVALKYRRLLGQVAVASLLVQLFGLSTPLFFMLIMDKVLVNHGLTTLDLLAIGLLTIGAFEFVIGWLRTRLLGYATHRIDIELSARLFRHLSALPVGYFAARQTGRTTARAQELQAVRSFLTGQSLTAVIDLMFTVVFLAVMAYFSVVLTVIVVVAMAIIFTAYGVAAPALKKKMSARQSQMTENNAFLVEAVSGMETVKCLAVEPGLQRAWERQIADQTASGDHIERISQGTSQVVTLVNRLAVAAVLYIGAKGVLDGWMTPGQLMAVNMITMRVLAPAQRVAQLLQQFHQVGLSVKRLGEIFSAPREPSVASAQALPAVKGAVRFDRVSFKYNPDGAEVLREVSFQVPAGQVVGIVGVSGAGKSTLARLIQRLYWPQRGRVLIDGVDLALVDPAWLRRQVAHVMQEPFLFNRSIRDNIALADPTLPIEAVMEAAELTGAHEFILSLPKGYDTVVGERGTMLSGGERQRIVLARALVTDPRILILDEATAALDYEAERLIQRNMKRICAGRTVFIIAHRLSTLSVCDRILVLDEGRLVEEGTHDALVTEGGVYARLYLGGERGGESGGELSAAPAPVRPVLDADDLRWPKSAKSGPAAPGLTPVLGGAAE
jgi:subfamily B ATP-binding cassette protein HlyB/CyaB